MPPASSRDPVEFGRTCSARELADRLATAEPAFLEGALENRGLDEELVLLLLHNRGATGSVLQRLSSEDRFRRSYNIRRDLAHHPNTPRAIAMGLVHHLFWRDLALCADDYRVPPPVRRIAVKLLESRLEDLALGEQITLARTGGRSVVLVMRRTRQEPVALALLENPRLVEDDLVAMAAIPDTPPPILDVIARSRRWMQRYRVRMALLQNRRTPVGTALTLLPGLLRRDLESLALHPERPRLLRLSAVRVLRQRGLRLRRPAEDGVEEAYLLTDQDADE